MEYWLIGVLSGTPVSITRKETDTAPSGDTARKQINNPAKSFFFGIEVSCSYIGCLLNGNYALLSVLMNYYAIQVKTRGEQKFMRLFKALHPDVRFSMHFPRRRIDIRRKGAMVQSTAAVFPGYVFIEAEEEEIRLRQWDFRRTDGFFRFLKSNQNIIPLVERDLELVLHFIKKTGPVAGISRVYFNENARIVIVEGPLMGLEGKIIKVDKRKKRAKVKLNLYDDSFAIDLAFEVIGALEK
jgi:transcriptional antiterminator NusG